MGWRRGNFNTYPAGACGLAGQRVCMTGLLAALRGWTWVSPTRSRTKLSVRKTRQHSRLGQSLERRLLVWAWHPQGAHRLACPALLSKAHQPVCSAAQQAHTPPLGGRPGEGRAVHVQQQLPHDWCEQSPRPPLYTPAGDQGAPDVGKEQQQRVCRERLSWRAGH